MKFYQNSIPLVSICCVTYNHEKYIGKTLDGFISQQTKFHFEVLVHEDASTDGTAGILKEYEIKYPNIFRCVYQTENQFLKQNTLTDLLFQMAKGKYIALCEGDDYWTDPYKLQKQVDFLEANKDYVICFHNTEERYENSEKPSFLYCREDQKETSTLEDLLYLSNFIPTCSVIFKNNLFNSFPKWFSDLGMGDWVIHILNSQYGKIKYINEVMGVHRIHSEGVWSKNTIDKNYILVYEAYVALSKHFRSNSSLLKITNAKEKEFLALIYTFYIYQKDKKTAAIYFNKFLNKNILHILKIRVIKDYVKIYLIK
ncbi:MAG: glycosyltransferase [Opitutaceae bacterium]|nr:glycosyltransferase [Cytophagales bacterium]